MKNVSKAIILMIEDNPHIMNINRITLTRCGLRILEAETLEQGRELLKLEKPDLVILDVMLPDGSGLDFCVEMRKKYILPVLFLTVLGGNQDILNGFDCGGDDYLLKPYDPKVLAARAEALLRRARYAETFVRGGLTVDMVRRLVLVNGKDAGLTQIQFSLLLFLIRNEGRMIQAERLYEEVWGQPMTGDTNAIKTTMSRLREKIKPAGFQIESVRGSGYRFEEDNEI